MDGDGLVGVVEILATTEVCVDNISIVLTASGTALGAVVKISVNVGTGVEDGTGSLSRRRRGSAPRRRSRLRRAVGVLVVLGRRSGTDVWVLGED